jgi:hypothetical protein
MFCKNFATPPPPLVPAIAECSTTRAVFTTPAYSHVDIPVRKNHQKTGLAVIFFEHYYAVMPAES